MAVLFGTDGVRGVANRELTPELAYTLGRCGAYVLLRECRAQRPRVLVGRDTRVSGQMLEAALTAGLTSMGADVVLLGILPTPGVAYLTRTWQADAGVMISASHNPIEDNGIKFFSGDGFKLPDEVEEEIEKVIFQAAPDGMLSLKSEDGLPRPVGKDVGRVEASSEALDAYVEFLKGTISTDLTGLKVVVDCGHGAAYQVSPRVLRELGAEVISLCDEPDGTRINVKCGSTNPEIVAAAVKEYKADLGIAHDGDADRVIAVDEQGRIVDGDYIMVICGLDLLEQGMLAANRIAVTVYSNLGVRAALQAAGGDVVVTPNGDRYVLEAMRQQGLNLGGEQSGHVIFLDHNTTGDGVLTALQLMKVMRKKGQPLSVLAEQLQKYPQVLRNVKVANKEAWEQNGRIKDAISAAEQQLGDQGRIFVRASGTEPLIRVMAEGPDHQLVEQVVAQVAEIIAAELGV
ncbi:MAG TPA: phosphoglucosamine mutase [Firmicutes bacterium]|nr:phosphoglucosamine mutase [Bacillota bacterium]